MAVYLVPSGGYLASHFSAATSQGGLRPLQAVPAESNTGALQLLPGGTITAAPNERIELVVDGDVGTATFKRSADGGTNWLGRVYDIVWDDAAAGGAGTSASISTAPDANPLSSKPCILDTDADGYGDTVFVAWVKAGTTSVYINKTTDLTGAGSWSSVATGVASGASDATRPVLVGKDGVLYLIYATAVGPALQCVKSTDYGVTWGTATTVVAAAAMGAGQIDGCLLANGRILVAYVDVNSDACVTSSGNGTNWRAGLVAKAGTFASVAVTQKLDGRSIIWCETAGNSILARSCTSKDPAKPTASWTAYAAWDDAAGAGTPPTDADDTFPTACVAPDGTVYVTWKEATSDAIEFSKLGPSDSVFSAKATAHNPGTDVITSPGVANIGGALWCAYADTTNDDIEMVVTKYWATYNVTTAPASWTGSAAQFLASGLWLAFGGGDGYAADYWDIDAQYDFGADRMLLLTPGRPARSSADGSAWVATFDLGASRLIGVDTICAYANGIDHIDVQFNATDSWGSPSVSTALSFVRETVASYTAVAGKVTRTSGTWTPHSLRGHYLRFGAIGASVTVYAIRDNDSTAIYVDGDLSAASGTLTVLSPRAWTTQTASGYRWMRVSIDAQKTPYGWYEVGVLVPGTRVTLNARHVAQVGWTTPYDDQRLRSGSIVRTVMGNARRFYALDMISVTSAEHDEVQNMVALQGSRPFALIPNSSVSYDWVLVQPGLETQWRKTRTSIPLEEVV